MEEESLLAAILAAPDDDAPRLVYADWLTSREDPRGELINVQCALAAETGDRRALRARERALLSEHGPRWLEAFGLQPQEGRIVRGLLEEISVQGARLGALGEGLARQPLRSLSVWELDDQLPALLELPWLPRLQALEVSRSRLTGDTLQQLLAIERLQGLTRLGLQDNPLGAQGLRTLAGAGLASLRALDLSGTRPGAEGLEALGASASLRGLVELVMKEARLAAAAARALASSTSLRGLVRLDLGANRIGDEGALALASSSSLPALAEIDLVANGLTWQGAAAMAELANLQRLTSLELGMNAIGDRGAQALARSSGLQELRRLGLGSNRIGREGAAALARLQAPSLVSLDLSGNPVGPEGGAALAGAEPLRGLSELHLAYSQLGPEGAAALAGAPLQELEALDLTGAGLGDEGVTALARSGQLRGLTSLRLGSNSLWPAAAVALAGARLDALEALELAGNYLGGEGAAVLAGCADLRGLVQLGLSSNSVGSEGATALAASPHLQGLQVLELDDDWIGPEGAMALVRSPYLQGLVSLEMSKNNLDEASTEALRGQFGERVVL